ncbi:hypothetical protein MAR_038439 [Mya arenaria]|uniref:Uncharacterized protein n=1 Tax=Mya arenaria TaxID=6604 RepID=A0ABY7FRC3_MYAAR|nr:hypothetical protein MAR_038439 [Mya arenaria]
MEKVVRDSITFICTEAFRSYGDWMLGGGNPLTVYIYYDFSKPFDTVPNPRLQVKHESNGLNGHLLIWSTAFFTDLSLTDRGYPVAFLKAVF